MKEEKNAPEQQPEEHHEGSVKDKLQEKISEIKESETVTEIRNYTKANKFESVIIALVVFAVIMTWFNPMIGLSLIGLLLGIYFTDDITTMCRQIEKYYQTNGWFKIVLFAGGLLSLLITVWPFIVGIAIAVGGKSIINSIQKSS